MCMFERKREETNLPARQWIIRTVYFELMSSISEIPSQMCYHCVHYSRRHHMSLIWCCSTLFCKSLLIWIYNIFKWAKWVKNGASKMRLGSYDGAWYTEHNGNTFMMISQILMKWAQVSVHQDNIWRNVVNGSLTITNYKIVFILDGIMSKT